MQGIASRSGCTSVNFQVAIAAVLIVQRQHNTCWWVTITLETQKMSKKMVADYFFAVHSVGHPWQLACWEVIWMRKQIHFHRSLSPQSRQVLLFWKRQQKPIQCSLHLGWVANKHKQLLRKVDEMETHASRTGACCRKSIKELKQCTAIPGSMAQGMKTILGSMKLPENDTQGG